MKGNVYTYLFWCFYSLVWKSKGDTSHIRAVVLFSISESLLLIIFLSCLGVLFYDFYNFFPFRSLDYRYLFGVVGLIIIGGNYYVLIRGRKYEKIKNLYNGKYSKKRGKIVAISILSACFLVMIASGIFLSKTINGW